MFGFAEVLTDDVTRIPLTLPVRYRNRKVRPFFFTCSAPIDVPLVFCRMWNLSLLPPVRKPFRFLSRHTALITAFISPVRWPECRNVFVSFFMYTSLLLFSFLSPSSQHHHFPLEHFTFLHTSKCLFKPNKNLSKLKLLL